MSIADPPMLDRPVRPMPPPASSPPPLAAPSTRRGTGMAAHQREPAPALVDTAAPPRSAAAAALPLYGRLLGAGSLAEAAHRLTADLSVLLGASRVSVGLRERGRTRLLAVSNLDDRRQGAELPALLIGAMDEAIDQGLALLHPAPAGPPGGVGALAGTDAIVLEQAALQRAGGGSVLTLPLGDLRCADPAGTGIGTSIGTSTGAGTGAARPGAVCIERHAGPAFTPADAARLAPMLALALPLLALLAQAEAPWHQRLRQHAHATWQALRRPEKATTRRALVAIALGLAGLLAWPLPQEVSGRARIEGARQRVLSAPADGFVQRAHARPGDRVAAGAALLDLAAQDIELDRERWASQLAQHEHGQASALAKGDRAQAAVAAARADEARAQLALLEGQLGRSRIVAPFDGVVIDGDWSRSAGAPVRQGDALITLAAGDQYRVIAEVDETDIARVQPGQPGRLLLSGGDWSGHALQVVRVAALARAVDGRNVFEVEARLLEAAPGLRPGLLGQAGIEVGQAPLPWTWARRAADRLRLAWWRFTA